jgi:HD-GYP domain-containing protein (c-di-GMP phosphodiesterase class II)
VAQRTISLTRLVVGMYLIGVNRSWLQTPFLRHKFKIKDQSEIEALRRAGITEVTIDTGQGLDIVDAEPSRSALVESVLVEPPMPIQPMAPFAATLSLPPTMMLAENFSKARQRRAEWVNRLNSLFEQTRITGLVDYDAASQLIDETIGDILDRQAACYAVLGLRQPDPTIHEHGLTVSTLSVILGQALNFPRERLQQLGVGGLLHDIGLARLPRNIVKRPKTMPPAQQALYESHTTQGGAILEKSGSSDQAVLAIVKGHHNLTAQIEQTGEISAAHQESARLIGIIDQYDELVTGQTGLTPMSSNQALTQLYQRHRADEALSQVVSYLIRAIGVYPLYSVVALSSGELAVVGAITPGKAHLPLLYICRNQSGETCSPPVSLDLVHEPEGGRTIRDVRNAEREGLDVEAVLRQVAA